MATHSSRIERRAEQKSTSENKIFSKSKTIQGHTRDNSGIDSYSRAKIAYMKPVRVSTGKQNSHSQSVDLNFKEAGNVRNCTNAETGQILFTTTSKGPQGKTLVNNY